MVTPNPKKSFEDTFIDPNKVIYQLEIISKNLIICGICKGILNLPVQCMNCKTCYCQACIMDYFNQYGTCPNNCEVSILINAPNQIIQQINNIYSNCSICSTTFPVSEYTEHYQIKHTRFCFNCEAIKANSDNIKVLLSEHYSKVAAHCDSVAIKSNKLNPIDAFIIFLQSKHYSGFIAVDNHGWFYLTFNRKKAAYFMFSFIKNEKYLKVYNEKENEWYLTGPHYDLGFGIFKNILYGAINLDPINETIESVSGRTEKMPLTVRRSDFYLFFYNPDDLYEKCFKAKCLFINEIDIYN